MPSFGNLSRRRVPAYRSTLECSFHSDEAVRAVTTAQHRIPDHDPIAGDFDHPVHDCFYFALAVQTQNPVVTADTRFHDDKVRNHGNLPCLSDRIVHVVHALSRGAGALPGNEP